jgi:hypothetical protein
MTYPQALEQRSQRHGGKRTSAKAQRATEGHIAKALRTRARCLSRRIWVTGWNDRDAEDFHSAVAEIRRDGDRELVAEDLLDCSHIWWISSQYRQAHRNVVEGLELHRNDRITIRISARHISAAC